MNRYICGVDVANGDDYGVTIMVINKDGVLMCNIEDENK